jgi:hypothetical protein
LPLLGVIVENSTSQGELTVSGGNSIGWVWPERWLMKPLKVWTRKQVPTKLPARLLSSWTLQTNQLSRNDWLLTFAGVVFDSMQSKELYKEPGRS